MLFTTYVQCIGQFTHVYLEFLYVQQCHPQEYPENILLLVHFLLFHYCTIQPYFLTDTVRLCVMNLQKPTHAAVIICLRSE